MIEVAGALPGTVAGSLEALAARLIRHIGKTIVVQHNTDSNPFAGELVWLRLKLSERRIELNAGRPLTERENNYPSINLNTAVYVVLDGTMHELHHPEWLTGESSIVKMSKF